ncbi:MAG: MFS transporter, partial [Pseudomonadota bacterium]
MKLERIRARYFNSSGVSRAYELLVEEEDARVCKDIDEQACRVVPGNFLLHVLTQFLTKLGDAIANPKTILAWLLGSLGAPALMTAFLVPIRESGSMVPQLFIASYVRRQPLRKWTFVLGCILQAIAVFSMALIALTLTGAIAGLTLLMALTLFSLARGLCSVASKDVLGKSVPKTRRGRVSGWSEFVAGLVTVSVGLWLLFGQDQVETQIGTYLTLLGLATGLWLLAGFTYSLIREYPGATEGSGNAIVTALQRLSLLKTDGPFLRFVVARSLLF